MQLRSIQRSFRVNVLFKYGNIALSLIGAILLVPYYLAHLSATEYGAWLAVGAFATWFAAMDPGVANLLIQRVARSFGERDTESLNGYVAAGLVTSGMVAGLVAAAGCGLAPRIVRWLDVQGLEHDLLLLAFRLSVLSTAVMILLYAFVAVLQGLHDSLAAGLLLLLAAIARIVLSVLFLALGFGFVALPIAALAAACVASCLAVLWLILRLQRLGVPLRLRLNRLVEFSSMFAYSFGARFAKSVTGNLDSVLIARVLGVDQVAVYALTATAPRQSENLINQPVGALRPTLAHLAGQEIAGRLALDGTVRRALRWMMWVSGLVLAGLLSLNDDFVRLWVGDDYYAGNSISIGLALLFCLRTFTNSVGAIGFSLGDVRRNSLAEWTYSIVLVPLAILGASYEGMLGVVFAHIAAQMFTMGWYFPRSVWRRLGWGRIEGREFLKELVASAVAVVLAWSASLSADTWLGFLAALFVVASVYIVILICASRAFRDEVHAWGLRVVAP